MVEREGETDRRLVAIMFTDMVGYSALSQSDEEQALQVLERHNRLIRSLLKKHNGKEVKTVGDSFLVEFESALVALRCAIDIQEHLHDYNLSSANDWMIKIRIGIHLGDVVHKDNDVLGDAVNIASRIEPFADPEGIAISQQVFDQVSNKIDSDFRRLAHRDLKNISKTPTAIFAVIPRWGTDKNIVDKTEPAKSHRLIDSKRIAVLPLANLSSDPENEYFAEGITEELISTLSSLQGLTVIARTSVMRYKATSKAVQEIGSELNVGTILEGSVRKQGDKIRVTAQLIDVASQGHIWSASYDRQLKDVFEVQTDVARQVAAASHVKLLAKDEQKIEHRESTSAEAYTCYLKGRYYLNERTEQSMKKALPYFERAINYDPNYAPAYSGLADTYSILCDFGLFDSHEGLPKARRYAQRAIELDPSSAEAHTSLAAILFHDWDFSGSLREIETSVELKPNYALGRHWHAVALSNFGRVNEAIEEIEHARDLDPFSPQVNTVVGIMYFNARQYDRAISELDKVLKLFPDFANAHACRAESLIMVGRHEEAIGEMETAVSLSTGSDVFKSDLAVAYALGGKHADAEELLRELEESAKKQYVSPLAFARIYAALGNKEKAMEWLDKADRDRVAELPHLKEDILFRELMADDTRFNDFLKKSRAFLG